MIPEVAIKFHEVIVLLITMFVLFIVGTWLSAKISASVNRKSPIHGSKDVCGACEALIETRRIPEMDKLQKDLRARDGTLAKLDRTVGDLTMITSSLRSDVTDLKNNVSKLFTMIEGDWQEQIRILKVKLSEKDQQIRRLEDKG